MIHNCRSRTLSGFFRKENFKCPFRVVKIQSPSITQSTMMLLLPLVIASTMLASPAPLVSNSEIALHACLFQTCIPYISTETLHSNAHNLASPTAKSVQKTCTGLTQLQGDADIKCSIGGAYRYFLSFFLHLSWKLIYRSRFTAKCPFQCERYSSSEADARLDMTLAWLKQNGQPRTSRGVLGHACYGTERRCPH